MTAITARLSAALAGRYRIERHLGEGGMASVYLAEDLKHDRKVAVKVLKPELAAVLGAERFVQEIKTTASLQHPHILPLFDSGTADGFLFYVMPFIKGETLREKLNRETQLGVDEAVRIAREIADALDYAHRSGVIHRDIKPENILLHDGRPMVADFGIALAVSAAAGGRMTETGLSLGTPHYMSPEQATAEKEISARSDVFSLASVLYEMLAGQPPHIGGSAQQIIMKIIAEPADQVTRFRKSVPPHVAAALAQALEKLPADRFESAKEFADALANPAYTGTTGLAISSVAARSGRRAQVVLGGVAAVLAIALVASLLTRPRPQLAATARYRITLLGTDSTSGKLWLRALDISDDASRLAWVDSAGAVWTRRRDVLEAEQIPGDLRDAPSIALSPDGNEIAVSSREVGLTVFPLTGGTPRVIVQQAGAAAGMDWGDDGFLYISVGQALLRIAAAGGPPEIVARDDSVANARLFGRPIALSGGRGFLYSRQNLEDSVVTIHVWDARTRQSKALGDGRPIGVAGGYLLTVSDDGTLFASRFDERSLALTSEPLAVERDVRYTTGFFRRPLAGLSRTGVLMFATGGSDASTRLARVRLDGRIEMLPAVAQTIRGVRVSPDGRRIAYGTLGRVRIHDMAIGSTRELMPAWRSAWDPLWSRDGKRIAFHSSHRESGDSARLVNLWTAYEVEVEEGAVPRRLFHHARATGPQSWSPDGSLLAHGNAGGDGSDLVVVRFEADSAKVTTYLNAPWQEAMPRLSPDGRWAAYRAIPEQEPQIWVRRFPDAAAGAWKVSERAATEPVWGVDGRTLYYLEEGSLVAARVRTSPDFAVISREVIVRNVPFAPTPCCSSNYDMLPDGSGFIMALRSAQSERKDEVIVVENLFTELRDRLLKKP